MSVDAAEPDDEGDEFLADDDTPAEAVPVEDKKGVGRPRAMDKRDSAKLSAQMWEEYAGGMNMQQIGDVHGMTRHAVWVRLRKHRSQLGLEEIDEAKSLDLGRYEALIERVWTKAFQKPDAENIRSLAMLMDQRAKLLGLNAPKRLQVAGEVALNPSPAFLGHLDRLIETRERLPGETSRPEIEAPDAEIVDAELVEDDGG